MLAVLVCYVTIDPFHVLGPLPETRVKYRISSDYFGTELYLKNKELGASYNTLVLGNSRVLAFDPLNVCAFVDQCNFYAWNAPGESLLNIRKKLEVFIDKEDETKLVLIILDGKILMNTDNNHPFYQGPTRLHHPLVSNRSWANFHIQNFQYFLTDFYWVRRLAYAVGLGEAFKSEFINDQDYHWYFDPETNYAINSRLEELAESSPQAYLQDRKAHFKKGNLTKSENKDLHLSGRDRAELEEIVRLCADSFDNYAIIFGPIWEGAPMSDKHREQFSQIIPENKWYDFRGMQPENSDTLLWYENSHYRPVVGAAILKEIFGEPTQLNQ